ncbi:hypothetical protein L915_06486 [Phytophthora nicotianae]|uniref:Uncharacterized protein n=1 Tax=Phytophthora nicotianae TaxID=4792 RepID=W2NL05_PHYNI|nr:hypothetical protein L915_06486 [Phytophthora nicotianae]ETM49240.1 hypothetical protein L914_06402 [Phytophthora nicotianae]
MDAAYQSFVNEPLPRAATPCCHDRNRGENQLRENKSRRYKG